MCISSQVGCAVRCTFCATGKDGRLRNLTVDEITGQVHRILANLDMLPSAFDVSFMGMGEPLHNAGSDLNPTSETKKRRFQVLCDEHGLSASRGRAWAETSQAAADSYGPLIRGDEQAKLGRADEERRRGRLG